MTYITVYTKSVKRRKSGKTEVVGCAYETKSLTSMHKAIRDKYSNAQTWKDARRVITEFVEGMNLGTMPIVRGGERIA
ncbi:hypothetical protein [Stenotrophomonas phage SOVA965]